MSAIAAPTHQCPVCPLAFYSKISRNDHVAYRHPEWALVVTAFFTEEDAWPTTSA